MKSQGILNYFLFSILSQERLLCSQREIDSVTSWLMQTERYNSGLLPAKQTLHSGFFCTFTQVVACTYTVIESENMLNGKGPIRIVKYNP